MQILTLLYYALRSLLLRGPLNTLKLMKGEKEEEERLKVDTRKFKQSRSARYFHYQPAAYSVLARIFSKLEPYTGTHRFVDIGCGRGRVMIYAADKGFKEVMGIELEKDLAEHALANANSYLTSNRGISIKVLNANAADVDYGNAHTVFFLFNPFNAEILKLVIGKILRQHAGDKIFVYMNPKYRECFNAKEFELISELKSAFYTEALIYRVKRGSQILS